MSLPKNNQEKKVLNGGKLSFFAQIQYYWRISQSYFYVNLYRKEVCYSDENQYPYEGFCGSLSHLCQGKGAFRYTPIATMYGQSHSRQSPLIFYWAVIVVLVLFNIDSLKVGIGVSTKSIPFMWSRLFALDEACALCFKVGCIGLKKHLCRHYCLYLCHLFSTTYNVILANQRCLIMWLHHPVPFSVPVSWYWSIL